MPQQPYSSLSRCLSSLVSLLLLGWRLLVGVGGVVSLFFLILFFARLGLGGQEALLVEVASGVLDDAEVFAILGHALPRAQLALVVLLPTT